MARGSTTLSRDAQPSQYLLNIQSYSNLLKLTSRYESNVFKVGKYKWRLVFHPTGNKKNNKQTHISLSLAIDDTHNPRDNWNVLVNFSFYVLDRKEGKGKYVTFPGSKGKEKKFDKNHLEHGCDEFLSIEDFKSEEKGYLRKDSCVFGVDVFVIQPSRITEVVSATSSSKPYKWTISSFNSRANKKVIRSEVFEKAGRKWKMELYPRGSGHVPDDGPPHVSLYLTLQDTTESRVTVHGKFVLKLIDQRAGRNLSREVGYEKFDYSLGCLTFFTTAEFENRKKDFIKDDTVQVKLESLVISEVKMESAY